jgi:propanol-preferring alcohol dehydrogenase
VSSTDWPIRSACSPERGTAQTYTDEGDPVRALQLKAFQTVPVIVELPDPEPGPGEVVVRIGGAGACHSDLHVMHDFVEGAAPWGPPFVIGHENAGWVHAVGAGVREVEVGEPVAVYGLNGCGRCKQCAAGAENFCIHGYERPPGVGFGIDGGMAEYLLVGDPRRLVPIGDLDPVDAAPLTDAGLTPYRAVKRMLPKLTPDASVLVIGAGGLGHLAIQILYAMTATQVIAVDTRKEALDLATEVGAHAAVIAGDEARAQITEVATGGRVELVLDFVGSEPTIALGTSVIQPGGDVVVVGAAAGSFTWNFYAMPYEANLTTTFWGTLAELHEVITMAQRGLIKPHVQRFALEDGMRAYDMMEHGQLSGRAVIVP